jgi:hypothetical protein
MNKLILFCVISFLTLNATQLEAQRFCCGQKCWYRWYIDPTIATYDGIRYGYIDNINYPNVYHYPRNCYFRPPPCRSSGNYQYFLKCCYNKNLTQNP